MAKKAFLKLIYPHKYPSKVIGNSSYYPFLKNYLNIYSDFKSLSPKEHY
jgi:hypothetical protein